MSVYKATFQGLVDALVTTVQRDDLQSTYLDFVNQGLRQCALAHSFPEMRKTGAGSVAVGETRATLPDDFKELQAGRYPIFDTPAGGTGSLVPVFIRQEVEKLLPANLVPPASYISTVDTTTGTEANYVDLPSAATVVHALVVYYYAFPAKCEDASGDVTDPMIEKYFNMILEKSASLAFQSINDPIWQEHERAYLMEYQQNSGNDVTRALKALQPVKG